MECSFDKEFLFRNGGTLLFRTGILYFIGYFKDLKREILMMERNYLLYERMNRLIFDEKLEKIWNALLNMFV